MSKHTPGPWTAREATASTPTMRVLLEALKTAERELNIAASRDPQASIALVAVRAAIAKAEGA